MRRAPRLPSEHKPSSSKSRESSSIDRPPAYEQVAPHCNANKKQLLLLKGLISKTMKTCNIFYTDLLSHVKGARNFSSPSFSNTEKMLLLKEWFNRLNVLIQGNIDPIIFNGISLEFYGSANPR